MDSSKNKNPERIALVCGSWSSNIGNALYNIGAEWLLKECGRSASIFPESPRWKESVDAEKHYDPIAELDVDLVVLNGPCLWKRLDYVYRDTFEKLYERGIKVAYLSAGMAYYDDAEAEWIARFMQEFPPEFIFTRDHKCFELLQPNAECPIFDGLCTSMFLPEAHTPISLVKNDYVVLNFDETEPELEFDEIGSARVIKKNAKRLPESILGFDVIRTDNRSIDTGYKKIYRRQNTYHSDLPWGYCSILSGAKTVYSERVHTCATALAYGRAAQFIRLSPRSHERRSLVFERIGVPETFNGPVRIDKDFLAKEKAKMIGELRKIRNSDFR